ADERELRRAGEDEHRHDARLGRAEAACDGEHAERDAVDAHRDADPDGAGDCPARRLGDRDVHLATIASCRGNILAFSTPPRLIRGMICPWTASIAQS